MIANVQARPRMTPHTNEVIGSAALCYGTGVKRFDLICFKLIEKEAAKYTNVKQYIYNRRSTVFNK